jgi:hypothetical protein
MQYQVFVQNPADRTFTASVVGLPNVITNGVTEQEAIDKLKEILEVQFTRAKFVTIDVGNSQASTTSARHPAGAFKNDPTFDDWMEKMTEIRQADNEVDRV